jgi:hypothetical protein
MNIVKNLNQFQDEFVYFFEPIPNNIVQNGKFIRILYSSPFVCLNGVYVFIHLQNITVEPYFNKFKCSFDSFSHQKLIQDIFAMEESILKKNALPNKIPLFKVTEQFKKGNIKLFSDCIPTGPFVLKISGIWETETHYGVTFKFLCKSG